MVNTLQPLSEVAIANMAATVLDDAALLSLNDPSSLGRFMAREFGFARDELIAKHVWAFAKTRVSLPKLSSAPAFGYDNQYQLPTDCIRVLPIRANGLHNGTLIKYEREGRLILTDEDAPLKVIYLRRVVNAAEFDPLFARTLGNYLAVMAAQRVTGKGSYLDKAQTLYNASIAEAYQVNSLEMGTPEDSINSSAYSNGHDTMTIRGVGL